MSGAAGRWTEELAAWEIPREILDSAPENPWGFPPALFGRAAPDATATPPAADQSRQRAVEVLGEGGSVLDVGSGGGAASLALVPPAGMGVAVDQSEELLASFAEAAGRRAVAHREVQGSWPAVATAVDAADVVVCHHVLYNAPDLVPFARALTDHARRRVVVELTARHPQVRLNHLWQELHGIGRPSGPTARDALAVLVESGLDVQAEHWERPLVRSGIDRADWVAFARRRLCVGAERDPEIDALLDPDHEGPLRQSVTLWWDGEA